MSVCLLCSFEKLWHQETSISGKVIVRTTTPWGFSNDFFAAPRFHPFLWEVITSLHHSNRWFIFPYASIVFSTGTCYVFFFFYFNNTIELFRYPKIKPVPIQRIVLENNKFLRITGKLASFKNIASIRMTCWSDCHVVSPSKKPCPHCLVLVGLRSGGRTCERDKL